MGIGENRPQDIDMLVELFYTNTDWVLTAVRIVLGVILFAHGAQKLLGWFEGPGLTRSLQTFADVLRIPAPLAFLAIATEFFGGLALIVGLFSRLAALGIAVIMIVAAATVHFRNGLFLNWFGEKKGHGFEYHLLALALALVVLVKGAGAFSLDRTVYEYLIDSAGAASTSSVDFL
jgi:putative oxidoreductase